MKVTTKINYRELSSGVTAEVNVEYESEHEEESSVKALNNQAQIEAQRLFAEAQGFANQCTNKKQGVPSTPWK